MKFSTWTFGCSWGKYFLQNNFNGVEQQLHSCVNLRICLKIMTASSEFKALFLPGNFMLILIFSFSGLLMHLESMLLLLKPSLGEGLFFSFKISNPSWTNTFKKYIKWHFRKLKWKQEQVQAQFKMIRLIDIKLPCQVAVKFSKPYSLFMHLFVQTLLRPA